MLIEPVEDDPIRQYTDLEKARLTLNLLRLTEQVRKIDSKTKDYSISLICSWHEQLFEEVRDHAGRYRSAEYGEDRLTFGPNRSIARADVPDKLIKHVRSGKELFDQLTSLEFSSTPTNFVNDVIKVALYLHAEFIEIHPFRDGNGRTGRLILTYVLCRYDLPSVAFEIPKQEYLDCLNHFYRTRDLNPLINLTLRLYSNQFLS